MDKDNYKLMDDAYKLAAVRHADQFYGSHSYMYHLSMVTNSVRVIATHIAVAYLHDILEDTSCTVAELSEFFPDEVVEAVVALTKIPGEDYYEYIARVKGNPIALHVKIHDSLCNLTESVKTQQWGRVRKYSKQLGLLCEVCDGNS